MAVAGAHNQGSDPWVGGVPLCCKPGRDGPGTRDYAPGLGMFTSLDTVAGSAQHPLSMNRFLYAEANPATLVDPSGHCTNSWWCDALTWNPMTSFVAPYLPDDAPRQVANAIQPVSPQAAMAIGMADRAGALTQDTVVGAYQLYRATTNPATAPRVARDGHDQADSGEGRNTHELWEVRWVAEDRAPTMPSVRRSRG